MYPVNTEFLENIRQEVKHQVLKIMSHPSIILWCGNNENEWGIGMWPGMQNNTHQLIQSYVDLYYDVVYPTVSKYDPSRFLWPSSPSNGFVSLDPLVGYWGNAIDETKGDVHTYNLGPLCTDFSLWPSPRFQSEYGFPSFASFNTLKQVSIPANWAWNSPFWEQRQHLGDGGINVIVNQMLLHFKKPQNSNQTELFLDYIYLTQCMQAICVKFETEHYRRGRDGTAHTYGSMYWQLNSIWQTPDWSSLEYHSRWKILHYYAKNFYSLLLLSSYQEPTSKNYIIHITSDLVSSANGIISVEIWSWVSSSLVKNFTLSYSLKPQSSQVLYNDSFQNLWTQTNCVSTTCFILLQPQNQNSLIASNFYFPTPLLQVNLPKATIQIVGVQQTSPNSVQVTLQTDKPAPFVFIETEIEGRFDDNGFVLVPNKNKILNFVGWDNFNVKDFQSTLRIKTVSQTY